MMMLAGFLGRSLLGSSNWKRTVGILKPYFLDRSKLSNIYSVPKRTCIFPKRFINFKQNPSKLIKKDNLGPHYELVYIGPASYYIYWFQGLSLILAGSILFIGFPIFFIKKLELNTEIPATKGQPFFRNKNEAIIGLVTVFVFTALIRLVCSRYVLRMYYNKPMDTFTGIFASWRLSNSFLVFKPGECKQISANNVWKSASGNMEVGKKRFFVLSEEFVTPFYYNKMLGYDKVPV